jgi:hypothetical protein
MSDTDDQGKWIWAFLLGVIVGALLMLGVGGGLWMVQARQAREMMMEAERARMEELAARERAEEVMLAAERARAEAEKAERARKEKGGK